VIRKGVDADSLNAMNAKVIVIGSNLVLWWR